MHALPVMRPFKAFLFGENNKANILPTNHSLAVVLATRAACVALAFLIHEGEVDNIKPLSIMLVPVKTCKFIFGAKCVEHLVRLAQFVVSVARLRDVCRGGRFSED